MKDNDALFHAGHRERMRAKFLADKLADYELLELLLGFVIPRRDVRPLARGLFQKYGGIFQILTQPYEELIKFDGVGCNTAIFLKAMQKAMTLGYKFSLNNNPVFFDYALLENYCRLQLLNKNVEEFHVLYLDRIHRLIVDDLHAIGTHDHAYIYPREILRRALELNAYHVVLVHNHPTAGVQFSSDDIELTTELQEKLNQNDIQLYDHYLLTGGVLVSARGEYFLNQTPSGI